MASLMEAPGLTQEENRGSGGNAAKDRDAVLAGDHAERTELSVEGDRSVEVRDGDQCRTQSPGLYGRVSGHGLPP
jgi:hypothetical protein